MTKEPYLAHSELTYEIYIVSGRNKYLVTDQAVKAVKAIQALSQELTVQDKQAESEKYQKAFDDGYANGYAQARFDYEQEPCDDAISRQAVLDEINRIGIKAFETYTDYSQLYDFVDTLPSVTQKSGKWIIDREVIDTTTKPTTYRFDTHCSECGFKYAYTTDKEDSIPTNFCPNCGARMVEPQEREEQE